MNFSPIRSKNKFCLYIFHKKVLSHILWWKFAKICKNILSHVTYYGVIYHSTKNKTILIKITNRFKLSVKYYSEKWSNVCHLDLWFRRYECLYFWWRHQFDVTSGKFSEPGGQVSRIAFFSLLCFLALCERRILLKLRYWIKRNYFLQIQERNEIFYKGFY